MNWIMERKKLSELHPAAYNPREIRQEAIDGLGGSIDRYGVLVPMIWNKRSGNIVGGHQRFKVLQSKGVEETDVVVVDLDDNEEVALNITMNNPATRGTFTKSVVGLLQESEKTMADDFFAAMSSGGLTSVNTLLVGGQFVYFGGLRIDEGIAVMSSRWNMSDRLEQLSTIVVRIDGRAKIYEFSRDETVGDVVLSLRPMSMPCRFIDIEEEV